MITLYSYFRSSTAYRVRIALNLKGVDYTTIPINLLKGEQAGEDYLSVNVAGGVPAIVQDDFTLGQSVAIMEYLDALKPDPRLVHGSSAEQAYIRQISFGIAMDIHPLINLKVLKYLSERFDADDAQKTAWYVHWASSGIRTVENMLRQRGWYGDYVLGDAVSMADCCLIPQMYGLRRYRVRLEEFPICRRIEANCMKLKAFQDAAPEMQPDAPEDLEQIHGPNFKAA